MRPLKEIIISVSIVNDPAMANAILLVSLMVLACLASIGYAEDDTEYSIEARRLINIYSNPAVSPATKEANLERLAKFYEQHSDRIQLTDEQRVRIRGLLERYKHSQGDEELLIDGVPANGGWISIILTVTGIVTDVVKLAKSSPGGVEVTSSSKGVEINGQVAIFGLVFLVASYMFRTKSM